MPINEPFSAIRHLRSLIPEATRSLVRACVGRCLDYRNLISLLLSGVADVCFSRLQSVQNAADRLVSGQWRRRVSESGGIIGSGVTSPGGPPPEAERAKSGVGYQSAPSLSHKVGGLKERNLGRAALPPLMAKNNYVTKSPLVTTGCPTFTPPKLPLSLRRSPQPSNVPIP